VIGYPSFVQLYAMGINDKSKFITVKVTGHQWYWRYEYILHLPTLITLAEDIGLFKKGDTGVGEVRSSEEGGLVDFSKASD